MARDPRLCETEMTAKATAPEMSLAQVRKELDAIDDALHDLLMQRAAVVMKVAEAKARAASAAGEGSFIAFRPGREAQILRRLAARHGGSLPVPVIFRLWREIISAMTQLQTPFRVEVFGGEGESALALWDLARSYYGSSTPMELHDSPRDVLRRISQDRWAIGILPAAGNYPGGDWWSALAGAGVNGPRVVARLPFISDGAAEPVSAYVIAQADFEPTGEDTSLLSVSALSDMSEARMVAAVREAGFVPVRLGLVSLQNGEARHMSLFAIAGHVASGDRRLEALNALSPDLDARLIGGYADPVRLVQSGA